MRITCDSIYTTIGPSELKFPRNTREKHRSRGGCGVRDNVRLEVREPDADLALSGLRRVGAVDDVFRHGQREVAADGARGGLGNRVGAASQLAPRLDGALALDNAGDQRSGGCLLYTSPSPRDS